MTFRLVLALLLMISVKVKAQQDSLKKTTLTLATMYSSDISYYGQATDQKLPYVLANATVRFPIGVYLSASSYKLLNYGSGLSEADLGVGYDYDFSDNFNVGFAYTRSFFPANSPLLQSANENNVNLATSYNWKWLKTTLSNDYAFGAQSDIFVSLNNSKEINLGSLNEKNMIFIEPAVELIGGTQRFYETYLIEKGKRDQAHGKGKGLGELPPKSNQAETVTYTSFNLLSYNLKLPLSLSRSSYVAEVSYQLSVLGPKAQAALKNQQSFFGFAFYYQL